MVLPARSPLDGVVSMTVNINDVVETITPDRAKQLLEMNTRNRNVLHSNLDILTEEIRKGRFVANGDAIRIAKDGTILDGQHRLLACVRAKPEPFPEIKGAY